MCGPALPIIALAGAAMSAAGTMASAVSANAQARYQAKIAERNASLEREGAQQSILNTQDEALAHYRKVAALKGAQRAAAAANGVGLDFGTAADVLGDTEMLSREDTNRIYKQGYQRTRGFEINASNDVAEASAKRQAGTGALISGALNAGSTLLEGASQYGKLKSGFG
jgi:hypothetical protein